MHSRTTTIQPRMHIPDQPKNLIVMIFWHPGWAVCCVLMLGWPGTLDRVGRLYVDGYGLTQIRVTLAAGLDCAAASGPSVRRAASVPLLRSPNLFQVRMVIHNPRRPD